ncbi:DUF7556 family protein [Halostagnicola bangensis]
MGRNGPRESDAARTEREVRASVDHGHSIPRFRLDERTEDGAWLSVQCPAVVSLQEWH